MIKKYNIKSRVYIILLGLSCALGIPEIEAQRFIKTMNFPGKNSFQDVTVLPDNSIVTVMNVWREEGDYFQLLRMNPVGDTIESSNLYDGACLALEKTENFYFVGGGRGPSRSEYLTQLNKYDLDWNLLWSKTYGEGLIFSICETSDGRHYIGGRMDGIGAATNSALYEIDDEGNLLRTLEFDLYSNSRLKYIFEDGSDLILIFDAQIVGTGFRGYVIIKLDPDTGNEVWRLDKDLRSYKNQVNFPVTGVKRLFGAEINDNGELTISTPDRLFFRVSSEGEIIDEVIDNDFNSQPFPYNLMIIDDGDYLLSGNCEMSGAIISFVERRKASGEVLWRRYPAVGTLMNSTIVGDTIYLVGVDNELITTPSEYKPLLVKMTSDGQLYDHGAHINIWEDVNRNCLKDESDIPLSGIRAFVEDVSHYSDQNGKIQFDLDAGTYNLDLDLPGYLSVCDTNEVTLVTSDTGYVEYDYLVQTTDCKELSANLTYTDLIRCEHSKIYIEYQNSSLQTIANAIIKLEVDEELNISETSIGYEEVDGAIVFDIGDVLPLTNGRIWLDIYTPCDVDLFVTKCFELSVEPQYKCDVENLGQINPVLTGACVDGIVTIDVHNISNDEVVAIKYRLFSDGYDFEIDSLSLSPNERRSFSFEPKGNTFSLVYYKALDGFLSTAESISIEGCGRQSNGAYSKGFKRMLDRPYNSIWKSKSCITVQDTYSDHRIFELGRGLSYFHVIDTTAKRLEFALRYRNDINEVIQELDITLSPNDLFDKNSFKELASSHDVEAVINSIGEVVIKGENLNIAPGEEFQYRFEYDLPIYESESNGFAQVLALGVANQNQRIYINNAFHNVLSFESEFTDTISPYTSMPNGFLFGQGHTIDLYGDMKFIGDEKLLISGTAYELGTTSPLHLIMSSSDNEVLWEKSYRFEEGEVNYSTIIPIGDGKILIVGGIDDAETILNYVNHQYAFILAINEDGEELWRNVWKPGLGQYAGGGIVDGVFMDNGQIYLGGYRYIDRTYSNFIIEIDSAGNFLRYISLTIGNTSKFRFQMKKGNNNQIFCGAEERNFPYSFEITKLNGNGSELLRGSYEYQLPGDRGSMKIVDFECTADDKIVLLGDGYTYDADSPGITHNFGRVVFLDDEINHDYSADFFHDLPLMVLSSLAIKDSSIYIGGAWNPDTVLAYDAFIAKLDFDGDVFWMAGKDLGADDFDRKILIGNDDRIYQAIQTRRTDFLFNDQIGYWTVLDSEATNSDEQYAGKEENLYEVFPNPTNDMVHIKGDLPVNDVFVFSMDGRKMNVPLISGNTCDVSQLSAGVYLLMIKDYEGRHHYHRLIKN